jgi:hypothetical protein
MLEFAPVASASNSTTGETGFIFWNPFPEGTAIALAIFLLVLGAGLVGLGWRQKSPIRLWRPWRWLMAVIVIVWILQILILLRIFKHIIEVDPSAGVTGPVLPVTLVSAICTFAAVVFLLRRSGTGSAILGGFVAAIAGPMVFEFPFILIVGPISTTPTHPGAALTGPFFIAMITTLLMISFSSKAAITKYSIYCLGAMFLVFAVWAGLYGFAYPSAGGPFLLNAVSKVLGFATTAALFVKSEPQAPPLLNTK